jgi:hypothetical protein
MKEEECRMKNEEFQKANDGIASVVVSRLCLDFRPQAGPYIKNAPPSLKLWRAGNAPVF